MLTDLLGLVQYLKKKYLQEKIVLLGHSWGSVLGSICIRQYTEEVAYYIGVGQVVAMAENERVGFGKLKRRAEQTAQKLSRHLGVIPLLRKEIREVNAGIDKPTPAKWFHENKAPLAGGLYDPDYKPFPSAESDRELWKRLAGFVEEIIGSDQENIILVSHGTALSFFFSIWLNGDFSSIGHFRFGSGSGGVSKLRLAADGKRWIEVLNDTSYMKDR